MTQSLLGGFGHCFMCSTDAIMPCNISVNFLAMHALHHWMLK